MTGKNGRSRAFDWAIVPLAVELRDRTGRTWAEIAKKLHIHPGDAPWSSIARPGT